MRQAKFVNKALLSLGLLIGISTSCLHAQYTGGEGDGYASTSTTFRIGEIPTVVADAQIGIVRENDAWTVVVQVEGVQQGIGIEVFDIQGRRLTHWNSASQGSWEERHELLNYSSAVYLFRVTIDDSHIFTEKIHNPYHRD